MIKKVGDNYIKADDKKVLRYKKIIEGKEYNVCVFNPKKEHFLEAGYRELVTAEMPEADFNQYIDTSYELKDDKYYEVHKLVDMPEVMVDE